MFRKLVLAAVATGLMTGPALADKVYRLKFGHFLPVQSLTHSNLFVPMAEKIKEETDGQVVIQIFPGGSLGRNPRAQLQLLMDGVTDISDDASRGRSELILRFDEDAIRRSGIHPLDIQRTLQLLADGAVVVGEVDQGGPRCGGQHLLQQGSGDSCVLGHQRAQIVGDATVAGQDIAGDAAVSGGDEGAAVGTLQECR